MKTFVIASLAAVVSLAGLVDDADALFGRRRARRSACCQTVQQSACCQPGMQGQQYNQGQQYHQGQPYNDPNQSFYRGDPSQAPAPPAPEDFQPNSLNEAPSLAPQQGGARIQGDAQIQGGAQGNQGGAQGSASGNVDL
jgi:hypothetical protein